MNTHNPSLALAFALLGALTLTGCDRNVTAGNAKAPRSPGTGNAAVFVAPVAADTPSGGSAVPGATGRGTSEMGARAQTVQPGSGTAGGLGGSSGLGMTGSFPSSGASAGGQGGSPSLSSASKQPSSHPSSSR